MSKPRALDLFCGAGGAAMGLHRAGFDVVGVDIKPQPRYPFAFVQGDALRPPVRLGDFDLVWASPPCQAYTGLSIKDGRHPQLIEPVRTMIRGHLHVIENVEGAPLEKPIRLCGSMFGLGVRRHRLFEANFPILTTNCSHARQDIRGYYGRNYGPALTSKDAIQRKGRKPLFRGTVAQGAKDMGIDWMDWDELRESIPPAYSEHIGRYAMMALEKHDAKD